MNCEYCQTRHDADRCPSCGAPDKRRNVMLIDASKCDPSTISLGYVQIFRTAHRIEEILLSGFTTPSP